MIKVNKTYRKTENLNVFLPTCSVLKTQAGLIKNFFLFYIIKQRILKCNPHVEGYVPDMTFTTKQLISNTIIVKVFV